MKIIKGTDLKIGDIVWDLEPTTQPRCQFKVIHTSPDLNSLIMEPITKDHLYITNPMIIKDETLQVVDFQLNCEEHWYLV